MEGKTTDRIRTILGFAETLGRDHPSLFGKARPLPLCAEIGDELVEAYPGVAPEVIRVFLSAHRHSVPYLVALAREGAMCHGLGGPRGPVPPEEAERARKELETARSRIPSVQRAAPHVNPNGELGILPA